MTDHLLNFSISLDDSNRLNFGEVDDEQLYLLYKLDYDFTKYPYLLIDCLYKQTPGENIPKFIRVEAIKQEGGKPRVVHRVNSKAFRLTEGGETVTANLSKYTDCEIWLKAAVDVYKQPIKTNTDIGIRSIYLYLGRDSLAGDTP